MKEQVNGIECGRENDLIAFLYGELNDLELRTFQHHIDDCPACGNQLDALKDVRTSVLAWRDESLGFARSRDDVRTSAASKQTPSRPSAYYALREFFNLSPLWMKGALGFATVLFCLFAGLVMTRWRELPRTSLANQATSDRPSEDEVKALVEHRVQEELMRIRNGDEQARNLSIATTTGLAADSATPPNRRHQVANVTIKKARRPLSSVERAELASDLRLVSDGNENELDLLDDAINK
ncbi:MAG: zf-HC2 domain-containing protein [Pyrinomonadaceae bacterium]